MGCPGACPPPDKYRGRGPTDTSYLREQMTQETLGGAEAKRRRFRNKYRLAKKKFYVEQLSAKVDKKDRDICRGDTRDARGLGDGRRAIALEFLATLD